MSVHYTGPLFQSAKQIRYTSPVYLRDILFRYTDLLYGSVIPASIPFTDPTYEKLDQMSP